MKITHLHLKNFKRFGAATLDFTNPSTGLAENMVLIQGSNGSGKTTVLQSITAMLGVATGNLSSLYDLDWPGWDPAMAHKAWPSAFEIELDVSFSEAELAATQDYWQRLKRYKPDLGVQPSMDTHVRLRCVGDRVLADTPAQLFQFRGRAYVSQLVSSDKTLHLPFEQVGRCVWYDVYREPISTKARKGDPPQEIEEGKKLNESQIRNKLKDLFYVHQHKGKDPALDRYLGIQAAFQQVFPERCLWGVDTEDLPSGDVKTLFYFHDGHKPYEVRELSGGERAVLPIIFDFVNFQIHRSTVLIDEVELHLNPLLQQRFIRALQDLGIDNQFILTSHSDYVNTVMRPKKIIDLDALHA